MKEALSYYIQKLGDLIIKLPFVFIYWTFNSGYSVFKLAVKKGLRF